MDEENAEAFLDSLKLPYKFLTFVLPNETPPFEEKRQQKLYFQSGFAPKLYHQILISSGFSKTIDLGRANIIVGSNKFENCHKFLLPHQKNDHFLRTFKIGSKIGYHAVMTMYSVKMGNMPSFYPNTFLLPEQQNEFDQHYAMHPNSVWIMKPTGGSCGRGIYIAKTKEDIVYEDKIIAQEYIQNPMLINGYKFDLRFYVAVTSLDPLRVYVYDNGLVRIATTPYVESRSNYTKLQAHLTNYSVNKESTNFVETDDLANDGNGNKWSLHHFWPFIEEQGFSSKKVKTEIYDSIATLFVAGRKALIPQKNHRLSVELYGVDVILDDKGGIHILEVNVSPAIGIGSALDLDIKSHLMRDFFNLSLIPDESIYQCAIEMEMEDGRRPHFKEYITILEFEEAEKRKGNFIRVYPTLEYDAKHIKQYDQTKLDGTLRLWISMDIYSRAEFMKKRKLSFEKYLPNDRPFTQLCRL